MPLNPESGCMRFCEDCPNRGVAKQDLREGASVEYEATVTRIVGQITAALHHQGNVIWLKDLEGNESHSFGSYEPNKVQKGIEECQGRVGSDCGAEYCYPLPPEVAAQTWRVTL